MVGSRRHNIGVTHRGTRINILATSWRRPLDGWRRPLVEGPMVALLLLSTGRPVALERLAGDGADLLRVRSRLDVR